MRTLVLGALLAVAASTASAARSAIQGELGIRAEVPPKWPDTYEMEYTLTLPYMQTIQDGGLSYPVHVWWDGPGQRYRFDVYGGLDSAGFNLHEGYNWNLYPRITEVACDFSNGTSGPTATASSRLTRQQLMAQLGLSEGESSSPLPDISGWSYAGTATVRNSEALVWQLSVRNGEKTATYQFFTARNGWPLRFYMMGRNILTGSHFDEYVVEFSRFRPGPIAAAAFALPAACKDAAAHREGAAGMAASAGSSGSGDRMRGVAARLGALLPVARLGGGPVVSSPILGELRSAALSALEANTRLVEQHNARYRVAMAAAAQTAANGNGNGNGNGGASGPSYGLALNRFAHLSHQQWAATSLGLKKRKERTAAGGGGSGAVAAVQLSPGGGGAGRSGGRYVRLLLDEQLPPSVDWRGTGADGPGVKDQVSCGSCWAFSAAGAMQGAWFVATGQSLSLSEQQLVDCAWDYGNDGCGGGFVEPTLQYVVDAGGIAQGADYLYAGQNTFCRGPIAPPPNASASITKGRAGEGAGEGRGRGGKAASSGSASTSRQAPPPVSARFSGYLNVPPRDEAALMEAVALRGPVAVLMNAAREPFKFYSEGVYHNPDCGEDPDSMDHAVLLVGYGTTPEGVDYWLIKNSWSKYWGMDGYARISRKGNDCGITTDPVLAVVDTEELGLGRLGAGTGGHAVEVQEAAS